MGALKYELSDFYDLVLTDWIGGGPEWNSGITFGGFAGKSYEMDNGGNVTVVEAPWNVAIAFDLRRPLKAQLAEAAPELEECQ